MREVDQVKGVMSENINQAMSNLESTEALNEKTQEMKAQSNMFNKQAKTAKNQMWWKNMKVGSRHALPPPRPQRKHGAEAALCAAQHHHRVRGGGDHHHHHHAVHMMVGRSVHPLAVCHYCAASCFSIAHPSHAMRDQLRHYTLYSYKVHGTRPRASRMYLFCLACARSSSAFAPPLPPPLVGLPEPMRFLLATCASDSFDA